MQNLNLNQIIANIEQGICFEATHNDDFSIKIQEYVPYICAAIHDGHRLREELKQICLLNDKERLYEEDPHTAVFIQSLPITLIGGDSRYEYDLNRDEENCIYDVAWGKQVWKRPLTNEEKEISLTKHRNFFKVVHALVSMLEKRFGACIVYDIHSYNYKRHERSFLFNIGIENIDIKKYNRHISHWKKELLTIKTPKINPEVSVNHIFYGRGNLLKYVKSNFKNTLVLATEIQKIFMNEDTGEAYPMVIQTLAKGFKNAIINNTTFFVNSLTNINIQKKGDLLHGDLPPELIKLDKDLYELVKNFEILSFVNPTNIEQEKKKFFAAKFNYNPEFKYKPLTLDPHEFKSKMYQLNVENIDDIHVKQVYIDIISAYADKVDMLANLGKEKFLYNSLRYFGEPSEKDIANANFLMYCKELPQFQDQKLLDYDEVKRIFTEEGKKYGFEFHIKQVTHIPSDALVINSEKTMYLKKGALFTPTRLNALLHHEIGVHMVTTMNANLQPLHFLSIGLPRNTYTQEGLAIMSELKSGCLTITRLKELGLRVLAVQCLTKGLDFKTTYQKLYNEHQIDADKLYYLVTRVYRGGGFTKDYLYLRGFKQILRMSEQGVNLNNLFLGKTTHNYLTLLNEFVDRGFLNAPKYKCFAFEAPKPIDPILQYLTKIIQ